MEWCCGWVCYCRVEEIRLVMALAACVRQGENEGQSLMSMMLIVPLGWMMASPPKTWMLV